MMSMHEMAEKLNKAAADYYSGNKTMSDEDYKKLYDNLVQLEKITGMILPISPTYKITCDVVKNRVEYDNLVALINYHMDLYYNQDSSEITDYEYDQLMVKLKAAEKQHPEWITPDSPTQKIGGTVKREAGIKVTHDVPMLSIEDVFDKEPVKEWINKVHAIHPDCTFSVETKIDGLSATFRYQKDSNGKLHFNLCETRGDGEIGEDKTENAQVIDDVKKIIDLPYDSLQIRGEVYMSHEDFERYNEKQEKEGKKLAANPRNLASGTLRQLDPNMVKERGLRMFIFNVQQGPDELTTSHSEALDILAAHNVPVVYHEKCKTAEEVISVIDLIEKLRNDLPYDIDGAVIKIDEVAYREDFPAGSKYSSGHIAYKYPSEERIVVMDEILVDVGRTGKLTFTGIFHDKETGKPARLCGTSVSRVTLHNMDYIKGMKIGIGGSYKVFKSGDIIPKLNGCVEEPKEVFETPTVCPICGSTLVQGNDAADVCCPNSNCKSQVIRKYIHFCERDCMNLEGISEETLSKFIAKGFINEFADLYKLDRFKDEIIAMDGFGKKSYDKIIDAIQKSRNTSFIPFIHSLGIPGNGKGQAKLFNKKYKGDVMAFFDDVHNRHGFQHIEGIGEILEDNLWKWGNEYLRWIPFQNDPEETVPGINREIEHLIKFLNFEKEEISSDNTLAGKVFVITGSLNQFANRDEMVAFIESKGGKVSGSVSKNTTALINNDLTSTSGKNQKARSLNIAVLSEDEFMKQYCS